VLDDRKSAILRAIVEEYVASGHPVGSAAVARAAELRVSSATVRNEMMVLEAQGYIDQPHTSAGRVPTDLGYRHYVDNLAGPHHLGAPDRAVVAEFFSRAHREIEDMLAETSRLLSRLTMYAAIVAEPHIEDTVLRDIYLGSLGPGTVLVVVIMSTGQVEKFILEHVPDEERARALASGVLTEALRGHAPFGALPSVDPSGDTDADELVSRVVRTIGEWSEDEAACPYYLGGAGNLVMSGTEVEVQHILEALEEQVAVVSMLSDALEASQLVVRIGSENLVPEMREWSIVTAPYLAGGRSLGAVGVVGPTRMNYIRAISAVEAVSAGLGSALAALASG
jgi:heat-inducible transcriptional repressor